jgi:predicted nucleic acid-binding protein
MAEFNKKDSRHKILGKFCKDISKVPNVELVYSKWAMTELINRLTKDQVDNLKIMKYSYELLDKNKLRGVPIKLIDVCSNNNYEFHDFFSDLTKDLIKYKTGKNRPGLGDIIHIRIMKNNKINMIATFDADYESIQTLTCINLFKNTAQKILQK